ncbi:MAG: quinoprotein dehydrogenase-associated SoxYZ-like carrier [Betaproteobacteria bacterium]|jgi:sulfur-oxidizing protein SoxY|nr:quinoprotein dehydrogenase-associated SoxYZ-like carrier [Betaproteobacteria bacterium]NBS93261.1 quinoprotein dehydrogenase-associated SoxYZ-like carrier [Betaproteobacteria bacterium]NBY53103.1 quinoprotein dehydrogenase-associated SoxYZ-like carrier [Betaproteobacteria bacterium]NCA24786.1 quinoprotein dehydrogenase-associated SoxYZ-like carrier [Betaproteobacteria bacterium]
MTSPRSLLRAVLVGIVSLMLGTSLAIAADEPSPDTEQWAGLRQYLFANRPIADNVGDVVDLDAPFRAEDASVVPIGLKAKIDQSGGRYIRKLWLVVDKNPTPVAASFELTPESGRADVETRIRLEEYTWVRVIAETSDGQLHMARKYVRAAGGCSAPAGKDNEAALARLGKIKFKLEGEVETGKPTLAQMMVSHPNNSGMQMDQVTRLFVPPQYVRHVEVAYGGKVILSADVDFSISENPNFRFYFMPKAGGSELTAKVVDSKDLTFSSTLSLPKVGI